MRLLCVALCIVTAQWMFAQAQFVRPDFCNLESESGPCRAMLSRYYYDAKEGACYNFKYGGCSGNRNNFETREECEGTCMGTGGGQKSSANVQTRSMTDASHCYLGMDQGNCKAAINKYYYDRATLRCFQFSYSGCGGNDNRFDSEESCLTNCTWPVLLGPTVDTCQENAEVGRCKAMIPRFYYNNTARTCQLFYFGGCGGNTNNFETKDQCEVRCLGGVQESKADKCLLPSDSGPCKGLLSRYSYDRASNTCYNFKYGGCGGNANNFESEDECKATCVMDREARNFNPGNVASKLYSLGVWSSVALAMACGFRR